MVTAEAFYKLYDSFPPLLKQVLGHREIPETNIALGKQFHLTPKQQRDLVKLESALIVQEFPPAQLQAQIEQTLNVDEDTARDLTREVLTRIALPMEWHVGNVQGLIHQLGGNVSEALAEAKRMFPEVYRPQEVPAASGELHGDEHALLRSFEDRVATMKGKAEILLRLTGLSVQVEEAVQQERMSQADGERLMRDLDSVSYAVNTKDLDPFEINALKRKIRKILKALEPTK